MSGVKEGVSEPGVVDFELVHAVYIRELELCYVLVASSDLLQSGPHERVDSHKLHHDVGCVLVRSEFSIRLEFLNFNAVFLFV